METRELAMPTLQQINLGANHFEIAAKDARFEANRESQETAIRARIARAEMCEQIAAELRALADKPKRDYILEILEVMGGVLYTDDDGVEWTGDGKGNVTPSNGKPSRRISDIFRVIRS